MRQINHSGQTIAARLSETRGFASGFNYLRLGLAVAIMVIHALDLTVPGRIAHAWEAPWQGLAVLVVPSALVVPAFFALSGFLVTASLTRAPDLAHYFTFRAVRVMPALILVVVLSALVIGPLVSELPATTYFSDPLFSRYFLNIFGLTQYELPGVFAHNPQPGVVNRSLWTISYELRCYFLLGALSLLGVVRQPTLLLAGLAVAVILLTCHGLFLTRTELTVSEMNGQGRLFIAFFSGVLLFLGRGRVVLRPRLFGAALLIAVPLAGLPQARYLAMPLVAYATVYVGLLDLPRRTFLMRGDYSYGLYLFAFPIQQLSLHLFPDRHEWAFNLATALPVTLLCAMISWHLVEQPAHDRRESALPLGRLIAWPLRRLLLAGPKA